MSRAGGDGRARSEMESSADWFARMHSDGRTMADEEAFILWLNENPRHAKAYRKCLHVWNMLGSVEKSIQPPPARALWQRREILATAASALLCVGGGLIFTRQAGARTYQTAVGEQRRISLSDGSDIILDTDSCLSFTYGMSVRCAKLLRGRAHISVSAYGKQPFIVECAAWSVSTRNAEMDLYRGQEGFSAFLTRGKGVATSRRGMTQALIAGERMRADRRQVLRDHPDITVMNAWKVGQLIFHDVSLSRAAAQMNRYSRKKLIIDDRKAGVLKISGAYKAGKCQDFARTIAMLLPVKTFEDQGMIHIATL